MNIQEQMKLIIKKAHRSLDAAKRNFDAGDYDFAASRAYYAAFYAVEAVLVTKGLSFSKHSALISAFNRHFVKTGRFPKELGKLLARLFRQRQLGDYAFDLAISEEDAQKDLNAAKAIIETIEAYLKQEKFLEA